MRACGLLAFALLFSGVARSQSVEAAHLKFHFGPGAAPNGTIENSFRDYPDRVKLVAREMNVPLIDLQFPSATLYEALGDEASHRAFATESEGTHHSDDGSYEIAKIIVQDIVAGDLPLRQFIVADFSGFGPAQPDSFAQFSLPASPLGTGGP